MKDIIILMMIMFLALHSGTTRVDPASLIYKGISSWYSEDDPGILETTANMEIFNDTSLTCAIWGIPFNASLKVTNLENGKSVLVRVNDRGPAKRFAHEGRIIDLTKQAFSKIADLNQGLIKVRIEIM